MIYLIVIYLFMLSFLFQVQLKPKLWKMSFIDVMILIWTSQPLIIYFCIHWKQVLKFDFAVLTSIDKVTRRLLGLARSKDRANLLVPKRPTSVQLEPEPQAKREADGLPKEIE